MSSDMLTQEEIDALMSGSSNETSDETQDTLSQETIDIIGEVGNISMSQAATTLSSLLNHKVLITTPSVSVLKMDKLMSEWDAPKVTTKIEFKEGLSGSNVLMINVHDAVVIADLMMGNSGEDLENKEFGELELSAVGEAMNQMIGSASTAMATMLKRKIDIFPPAIEKWDTNEDMTATEFSSTEMMCRIEFDLTVEGVIDSKIMQIFSLNTVNDIAEIVLSDEAEVMSNRQQSKPQQTENTTDTQQTVEQDQKVAVHKPAFQELEESETAGAPRNLDLIMDVPLEFSVVLGKSRKTIKDVLGLGTGSVVELDKMTDEPLEIYVNGQLIAEGEVVVINESFGVRITNILSKEQRIRHLK